MKNIIITGASSGIGEAVARKLALSNHQLLLIARNEKKLLKLQEELGAKVEIAVCDVRDHNLIGEKINDIKSKWGQIDVLINNAGIGFFDPLSDGHLEQWHEMIDTNVKGLLNCIHAALPYLIASKGQIINIGSVGAHQVFPNSGVYCATKHAVLAISESIRIELADKVRVTTISPGSVNTSFIDSSTNKSMLDQYKDYFATGLSPDLVADQILHAINCPIESVISEIIIRPSRAMK